MIKIVLLILIDFLYEMAIFFLASYQQIKPLPDLVQDIYSKERYQTFLAYKKETRTLFVSINSLV